MSFYSKLLSVFLFIIIIIPENSFPQFKSAGIGDISVKKWKDDYTAAFSFTFDDCMQSQYDHVFPIFEQYGFLGTFYVITGPLDDPYGPYWRYGTWPEFIEMSVAGNEIGSHTVTHPHLQNLPIGDSLTSGTLIYELYHSKNRIEQKIPDKKCIDLAYPYSEYDNDVIFYTSRYYEVARAISVDPVDSSLSGQDWYKIGSRVIVFDMPRNSPDDDLDELQEFYNYVDSTINEGKWGLLQAHDVIPFDSIQIAIDQGSYQPISIQWFDAACQFVSQAEQNGDLWVAPVRDITRYMKERDSYDYDIISVTDTSIIINISDTLNNDIYDFPLTADIIVPDNWSTASIFQGSFYDYTSSYMSGSSTVIETSVIPDGGNVIIYKGLVTGIDHIVQYPEQFLLYQNYPNPFNPTTTISFTLPSDGVVTLKVYNSLGQEVTTIEHGYTNKGNHKVSFNAEDLPSGIYYYRIIAGKYSAVKKMILLK
jgi:peptidoglycan/xylan/chitin deacetylase (PgdA/CDA1 family)